MDLLVLLQPFALRSSQFLQANSRMDFDFSAILSLALDLWQLVAFLQQALISFAQMGCSRTDLLSEFLGFLRVRSLIAGPCSVLRPFLPRKEN